MKVLRGNYLNRKIIFLKPLMEELMQVTGSKQQLENEDNIIEIDRSSDGDRNVDSTSQLRHIQREEALGKVNSGTLLGAITR